MTTPVFRFAPSPNGFLHLGHAASALTNLELAAALDGQALLRIEDIDHTRCREHFVTAIEEDLAWLGLRFAAPPLRQSTRFGAYAAAADRLKHRGLLFPCFCTRQDLARDRDPSRSDPASFDPAGFDPDGAPLYSGRCRALAVEIVAERIAAGEPHAWRIHMAKAIDAAAMPLHWQEGHPLGEARPIGAEPALWGDAVILRKEFPASYHLAVVVDDAAQGITHVVRGKDLYAATGLHRLLQHLLGLPAPQYHHHGLIRDADGQKLAKSIASTAIRELRASGLTPAEVIRQARLAD